MKIALVNKFYPPIIGGIEYHVRVLAENLEQYSAIEKIEILVANDKNVLSESQISDKIHITRLPNWKTIASTPLAPAFINNFKKLNVDLFHFNFPYPFADFSWLVSQDIRPFVITYHSDILRQRLLNKIYAPLRDHFFSKASRIFATSPNLVESSPILGKYRNKIDVIPLGIDPSLYLSEDAVLRGTKIKDSFAGKPIVLFVGRLVYYKGVEVLLEAFKDIDAELIMIGKGNLENKLRTMSIQYKIEDKVHFYSGIDDNALAAYFNACDIFVLPSVANTEAYGLVQLEAQACGKPIISTNLPTGVPFVNQHNETGLIVEPESVNDLKEAINRLVNDTDFRVKLGKQAKERMLNKFTDKEMTKKVYKSYCNILNKGSL